MASIHKLSPDVVNRIAAGEVVQRPSAALKELLENAIDADCTRIQVLAADGGLEALQVGDDGSGIHREDLPLLCERYATSKLQSFEDLHRVTSFGFRGEALASISYVSRVTVTTRRRPAAPADASTATTSAAASSGAAQVAWRAQYLNGSLTADPQPCAGNFGTTIRAEKLFYNALVRRNSLRPSEEWGRIVDVVSRYALAYPKVGFTCQRDQSNGGGTGAGLSGAAASGGGGGGGGALNSGGINFPPNSTTRQNIRLSHGHHIVSHLRLVYAYEVGSADAAGDDGDAGSADGAAPPTSSSSSSSDDAQHTAAQESRVFAQMHQRAHHVRSAVGAAGEGLFTLVGYTSDPTLTQRKPYLCLFINQRLVESAAVRRAIDSVYSGILTGGNRPFTVLFITVPTDRLDVNVHPTKKEVFLLDEELIVARVSEVCRGAVLEAAAARQMDMLKMRHTTALALKQMPVADGTGGTDSDANDLSGSSSQHILEKLRDQHRRGAPMASPLTSSAAAAAPTATPGGGPAVVVAPCTMVRVEPQRGALDRYFAQRLAAGGTAALTEAEQRSSTSTDPIVVDAPFSQQASASSLDVGSGVLVPAAAASAGASAAGVGADASPSWDTVMASLQRATAALEASEPGRAVVPPTVSASAEQLSGRNRDEDSRMNGAAAETARGAEAMVQGLMPASAHGKRRRDGNTDSEVSGNSSADHASDYGSEGEEEDRMREFKRHRQGVHERVEALRGDAAPPTKQEPKPLPCHSGTPTALAARRSEGADGTAEAAVSGGGGVEADRKGDAQGALARLGAVVQAADLLRDEAAAVAAHAETFQHVVSSSDDDGKNAEGDGGTAHDAGNAASSLVAVAEVEAPAVLSSVSIIVDGILANTSPSAASLMGQLSFVGAIDGRAFLAQIGTTLVWGDTMCLVRHVVFQRIFLRWGQPALPAPSVLEFDVPLPLSDLLATALAFDAPYLQPPSAALLALVEGGGREADGASRCDAGNRGVAHVQQSGLSAEAVQRMGGMSARAWRQRLFEPEANTSAMEAASAPQPRPTLPQPTPATQRYIRRLVRRLCRWRGLLKEYFFIDITADGLLLSVPHGLNRHWPPLLRALPLTMWRLAEAVPYPSAPTVAGGGPAELAATGEAEPSSAPPSAGVTPAPTQTAAAAEADGVAQEVACFTAVARHLADTLYGLQAPPPPARTPSPHPSASLEEAPVLVGDASTLQGATEEAWYEELVQHGLFPCLKNAQLFRLPDQCLRDGTIQSMVSVESLYKVFERC